MKNLAGQLVRAAKVILYTDKGDTFVYKLGDPDGHASLHFMVEVDSDVDTVVDSYGNSKMIKTGQRTKLTIEN